MKAATLVSRCSEKDLFDLAWLFARFEGLTIEDLVRLGNEIDGGVNAESVLSSVSGAILSKEACDFALDPKVTKADVYSEIVELKRNLVTGLLSHLESKPVPELGKLVRKLERLER